MPLTPTAPNTSTGLSQRDQFAAMAMQGILAHGIAVVGDRAMSADEKNALLAKNAFALADAMIVESEKTV